MKIKGMDGQEHNVASSATGNAALTTGIIGTALGVLNGGNGSGLLGGLLGGGGGRPVEVITSDDRPISRYEAKMMQELAAKDGKIALLEANEYTNQKEAELYKTLHGEIKELSVEVRANKSSQDALNLQQAVYNGTNTAAIECMKGQIAQLASLSQIVVPARNVCDTGCGCGN